jgi:NADH dehydrogenase
MKINIVESNLERIVIVGGGFAGLMLAKKLAKANYQIVLLDKNNYHQFQPLFYQVATAGLEPSSIAFPLRKFFQGNSNVFIRVTEVTAIEPENKRLQTQLGIVNYDHLVIASGADTNFFGNAALAAKALPMKSVSEALYLRNRILDDYEKTLSIIDMEERQGYIDIVIVGGGPTGVEIAGSLAEMRKYILPKDYPEMNCEEIDIYLIQSGDHLLKGMSEKAAKKALDFLQKLGVQVILNNRVTSYDGEFVKMKDGTTIRSRKMIWAAGIHGAIFKGFPAEAIGPGNRLNVDNQCRVTGLENVYALGDVALMSGDEKFPEGHPQVAQVAMQMGKYLADAFKRKQKGKPLGTFAYRDLGSMATIGRNKAVVDLPGFSFQGFFAWLVWLFVHLFQLLGVRNKVMVFINWLWSYATYDQSLRLMIRPHVPPKEEKSE